MAPKGRAEGAGCVFPWKTRRGGREDRVERERKDESMREDACRKR